MFKCVYFANNLYDYWRLTLCKYLVGMQISCMNVKLFDSMTKIIEL